MTRSGNSNAADKLLYGGFLALLIWIPIPLGSTRPWSWMVLELAVYFLLVAWVILWALRKVVVSEAACVAWPALALLGAWLLLQAVYLVPMPRSLVGILSPEAARVSALVASSEWTSLSVDPNASRTSFYKSLAYVGAFVLALLLLNSRSRVFNLMRVLVYAALGHAIYAVTLHLADWKDDFFGMPISHGPSASGTYTNRNHFAGYLEMMLSLGIGLLIVELSDRWADSWRKFVRYAIDWVLSPKMVLRLSLCILVIALTTTHSRMGNTAFFSSLLIAGVIGIVLSKRATRNTVLLLASLVLIDLMIVGSWFGVEKLARRIETTTVQDVQEREVPAAHSLALIRDYPVFGAGPGSFYVAFPRYRESNVQAFFDHAHNDYAQFASESGLLGLGVIGAFVVWCLGCALRAQWKRSDPLMRGASFASIMGVTSILIHSWVDFNLQIPANAVFFVILLAMGCISLHLDRHGGTPPVRRQ